MNYDPNIRWNDTVVELRLQQWEYSGTLRVVVGGNCKGRSVLESAMELDDENSIMYNGCGFEVVEDDDGEYWFKCTLIDAENNELEVEEEIDDLDDFIVSATIISISEQDD